MAQQLLFSLVKQQIVLKGTRVQYTIEARELTTEYTHRPAISRESQRTTVEADDADEAIVQFLNQSESELVSLMKPARGQESIATIKKDDSVYLVRVYAA